eukprot:CAMPEP_0172054106 /NCGR_PEP_ID=MMETSP1043-20130122/4573_1 /TAXON_ID=464988 /ORGANISM="Hemiselmis andersenii, Strain CCMP441" /LENGTH=230 /DNA_ID=CAMNT_0012713421 /DNA_START=130 /DNA_END=820 /DNA_ORIENTATION=+
MAAFSKHKSTGSTQNSPLKRLPWHAAPETVVDTTNTQRGQPGTPPLQFESMSCPTPASDAKSSADCIHDAEDTRPSEPSEADAARKVLPAPPPVVPSDVGVAVAAIKIETPRVFRARSGASISSPFLDLFQITRESRRSDFEVKWGPKEMAGTVMARQTAKLGQEGAHMRNRVLLEALFRGLSDLLPAEGKRALCANLSEFRQRSIGAEALSEEVKGLVDQYNIVVPFDN